MSVEVVVRQPAQGCQLLTVAGEVDLESVGQFEQAARQVVEAKPRAILVDMTKTPYMGSCGIRVLLDLSMQMERESGQLILIGASGGVLAALELVGLTEMLTMVETEAQALQLLRITPEQQSAGQSATK
jgi:anti-sigma B factor antagonist